jgi:hypothetical protein
LNDYFLPVYNTPEGKEIYDSTLQLVRAKYPQYVDEIEGIADGAKVDFHKVTVIPKIAKRKMKRIQSIFS